MLPFLPVYARQQGISPAGIGLIYTILPFVGLFAKAASGALADLLRIHRGVFLSAIAVCTLGFFRYVLTWLLWSCFDVPWMDNDHFTLCTEHRKALFLQLLIIHITQAHHHFGFEILIRLLFDITPS